MRGAGCRILVPGSCFWNGAVAQLGERLICIQEVVGSTPIGSTNQRTEARGQGSEGRRRGKREAVSALDLTGGRSRVLVW